MYTCASCCLTVLDQAYCTFRVCVLSVLEMLLCVYGVVWLKSRHCAVTGPSEIALFINTFEACSVLKVMIFSKLISLIYF